MRDCVEAEKQLTLLERGGVRRTSWKRWQFSYSLKDEKSGEGLADGRNGVEKTTTHGSETIRHHKTTLYRLPFAGAENWSCIGWVQSSCGA